MKTYHPLKLELIIALDEEKAPYPLLDRELTAAECLIASLPQHINDFTEIHAARITAELLDAEQALVN